MGHLLLGLLLPGAIGQGNLTELSGEVGWALAPVSGAALPAIHAGQMADN